MSLTVMASSDISLSLDTKAHTVIKSNEPSKDTEKTDSNKTSENVAISKKESLEKTELSDNGSASTCSHFHNASTNPRSPNFSQTFDEKRLNGVKRLHNDPKVNVLGNTLPLTPESWTVPSDNQIWLDWCNSFRSCGDYIRNLQPNTVKMNGGHMGSPNHLYSPPHSGSCPQGHPNNSGSLNYNRNSQYVVHLHVNPGETISFDMGDHMQLIQGPATVRMVSSNNTPPVPMPVQVPPGHMVQQIVDENGTLRHIILSPQPPLAVSVGNPYNGAASSNVSSHVGGNSPFYLYPHHSYSMPHQFPPHMQAGIGNLHSSMETSQIHQANGHSTCAGHTDSSSHISSFKDERTQRQFFKLKKRLEARQKDGTIFHATPNETVPKTTDESLQSKNKTSDKDAVLLEILSSMKLPLVSEITSTSALVEWASPNFNYDSKAELNDSESKILELKTTELKPKQKSSELEPEPKSTEHNPTKLKIIELKTSEIVYDLLLCDKNKDSKSKVIYSGKETKFPLCDLKPATSYFVNIQAKVNKLSGNLSEAASFKTLCCQPDVPPVPKLSSRTKTSISIKWNAAVDNGAKITTYILEYDEGTGSDDFVEIFSGLQKQFKATKLKASTCYRFRLAAVNELGKSDYSGVSCFSTCGTSPSQPLPPTLQEASVHKLKLEWEQRPNDDNYTLQMEDDRNNYGFLPVYDGKDTMFCCINLFHNTIYKFRLSASNDEGTSPWSQIVSYSTLPDRPGKTGKPVLKGKIHPTLFKVCWDHPKEDGGCPVSDYTLEIDKGNGFEVTYCGSELENICDNLEPGKLYSLRVFCCGKGGKSDYSEIGTIVTCPVIPGKCLSPKIHGKAKAFSIHLKWMQPEYNGGSELIDYEIEVTNPDGTSRYAYKGSAFDCVVAGLSPGRIYKFRVRAYNKVGAGPWSDDLEAVSGAGVPDSPVNVQIVPRSPHSLFASWSEPFNNGAIITEYRLECKCNEKDYELVYSGLSCSAEVKSLTPATVYHLQVQAVNSAGAGPFSTSASCQTPPSSPSSVSTANIKTTIAASTISLSWKEPNNHGSPILSYNIEIGDALHTTDGDNPEICIEGLIPETSYKVRLQAINSVGPGPFSSPIKIVTRGLPPLPPLLECCSSSHNTLRLKWGDGKNLDAKTFTLEMESPQSKRFIPVYQGPGYTFKVSKLQESSSYTFRIFASNEEGDGPTSDAFVFTTIRALPTALKAPKISNTTESSCLIEWFPAKAIGDDVLSYKLQLGSKESDFHVIYAGIQTSFTVQDLNPGSEYSVRVAAVRHCSEEALAGPFSQCTAFCTVSPVVTFTDQPPKAFSVVNSLKNRQPLTDQQWAMIILCAFTFLAVCVAIIIQQVLSYTTS